MKYAVFSVAALGMIPLAVLLSVNRRWMKYAIWAMITALCLYQSTAINFFSNESYRGSARGMEVSFVFLLAFALVLASAIRSSFPGFLPSLGIKIYAVYFLLCLPSYATAENALFGWFETWKMLMIYLTYLGVRAYLKSTDNIKALLQAFAVFAICNFLSIVKAHFSGMYQPHGLFPHQNSMVMAMHLLGGLFFAAYLEKGARRNWLLCFAFVAAGGAAVRSYSRAAIALIPVAYGITCLLMATKGAGLGLSRMTKRLAPLAVIGLTGLALMLPRIIERFETAPEASGNTRVQLAKCAVEMIRDEPWRGVGINNWGIKINPPYEYAELAGRDTNRGEDFRDGIVETVYLLVGAECGIPALVFMCLWFFYYFFLAVRLVWKLAGSVYCSIAAGLAGGLFVSYAQSCLEWVLRQQVNLIILVIFFALLDHLNANARRYVAEAKEAKLKRKGRTLNVTAA